MGKAGSSWESIRTEPVGPTHLLTPSGICLYFKRTDSSSNHPKTGWVRPDQFNYQVELAHPYWEPILSILLQKQKATFCFAGVNNLIQISIYYEYNIGVKIYIAKSIKKSQNMAAARFITKQKAKKYKSIRTRLRFYSSFIQHKKLSCGEYECDTMEEETSLIHT